MCEVTKEQQAEEENAARKSETAGRATKGGALVGAAGAGKVRKAVEELGKAGVRIAGAKKTSKRRSVRDGGEMLKQAADQALVEITNVVVGKLKEGAKEGKLDFVKTLVSLSEKKKPQVKVRRGLSPNMRYIEELANEEQWVDPEPWGPGVPGPGAPFGSRVPV